MVCVPVIKGSMPEVLTYTALICACEKGQQPRRAAEVFQAMQGEVQNGLSGGTFATPPPTTYHI